MDDQAILASFLAERDVPCPACGYNLRGGTSAVCPECGETFSLHVKVANPFIGWRHLIVATLLGYLIWGLISVLSYAFFLVQVVGSPPGIPLQNYLPWTIQTLVTLVLGLIAALRLARLRTRHRTADIARRWQRAAHRVIALGAVQTLVSCVLLLGRLILW